MDKKKNSFIESMLNKSTPNESFVEKSGVETANNNLNNEDTVSAVTSKSKGDKNSLFIQNCVTAYQNLEYSKNEKVTLNIHPTINKKLKLLSMAVEGVTAFDLGNAILHDYFETHKKEIAVLMKKLQI
jgi:hypothetical protein